jgi:penicillin G amidase
MKRWAIRLLVAASAALVLVLLVAWLTLRASLPELDGTVSLAGITATATIQRDAAGIPTITARNREDLAFATGFAHGQDRFFQMDMIRRRAAGELSAVVGKAALPSDRHYRLHRFRSRAQRAVKALPPGEAAVLQAYARGVNAGLASLAAKPFEYFVLRAEPEPWRPEDSVLVVYAMFVQLNDAWARRDIRRGLAKRVLPPEVFAWMYPAGTSWDAPLMGNPWPALPIPAADTFAVRNFRGTAPPSNEIGKPLLNGSNNWAVSGALTTTGRAIVSNDMHLGLATPNIYYRARLVIDRPERREVTGVTLPGTPLVVAGSNGRIAWGYTNSYGDWSDAVLLRPGLAPGSYRTPDGDRQFDVHDEVIDVAGGAPETLEVRETVWGPVLDGVEYPDGELAVSWIGDRIEAVNLHMIALETAGSVEQALDIANTMGIPPQNFVVGDADGNIGWTIAGRIPRRGEYDSTVPVDWSESDGWHGWLDPADYPRIVNPDSGRIWTANARTMDGPALGLIGDGGYDLGARARQIRDALFAKDRFEPADMLAIQTDDRALFLKRWRNLLVAVLDKGSIAGDPQLAEYRKLVQDWNPRADADSVGYRLVRAFRLEVQARVFYGLMAPVRQVYGDEVRLRISNQFEGPLWQLVTTQPEHLLPGGYSSWRELLLDAARENVHYFEDNYDGDLDQRSWGELNTAQIDHPLSAAIPLLGRFLDMPHEPLSGDVDMPRAQGPRFGASERFSVAPGDEAHGLMQMPTGQSGHPLSGFYRRGHEDWVQGRPEPFLPGQTCYTLRLEPREQGQP